MTWFHWLIILAAIHMNLTKKLTPRNQFEDIEHSFIDRSEATNGFNMEDVLAFLTNVGRKHYRGEATSSDSDETTDPDQVTVVRDDSAHIMLSEQRGQGLKRGKSKAKSKSKSKSKSSETDAPTTTQGATTPTTQGATTPTTQEATTSTTQEATTPTTQEATTPTTQEVTTQGATTPTTQEATTPTTQGATTTKGITYRPEDTAYVIIPARKAREMKPRSKPKRSEKLFKHKNNPKPRSTGETKSETLTGSDDVVLEKAAHVVSTIQAQNIQQGRIDKTSGVSANSDPNKGVVTGHLHNLVEDKDDAEANDIK